MLRVNLICIGKLKEKYWRDAVAEYEKRLGPLCKFQIVELPEQRLPNEPSQAQIQEGLRLEGEQILKAAGGTIVPLCIEGTEIDSPGMAKLLEKSMLSPGEISFVIGSSFGLSPEVKKQGRGLSMSPMTFPHQLARVMLCEQIYRGFQILQNSKYHK
jgi:23S rRNA (pseudouridine1915-N3)-methyltransferase